MKKDQKLYAVMGSNIQSGYPSSKDTATFKKIVLTDPDLFRHGEAYVTAYHKHQDSLEAEQTELEAKKREFVDPIDKRLQEIRDELRAISSYANSIHNSLFGSRSTDRIPFLAREGYTYNGTEKPGVYEHLQKIKFNDDGTYQVSYADEEHQVEPEVEPETEPA